MNNNPPFKLNQMSPEFARSLGLADPEVSRRYINSVTDYAKAHAAYCLLPDGDPQLPEAFKQLELARWAKNKAAADVDTSARNIGTLHPADYTIGPDRLHVVDTVEFSDCIVGRSESGRIIDYLEKEKGSTGIILDENGEGYGTKRLPVEFAPARVRYKAAHHPVKMEQRIAAKFQAGGEMGMEKKSEPAAPGLGM